MTVPNPPLGTIAVDTFTNAVGAVIESANGLVRLQHPNGCSWKAYATNLRPPGPGETRRYEAAERTWAHLGPARRVTDGQCREQAIRPLPS